MKIPERCERCGQRPPYAIDVHSSGGGYPRPSDLTWTYVCDADECVRLASYRIEFKAIVRDGSNDWNEHLAKKVWYNVALSLEIADLETELRARIGTERAASRWLVGKPPRCNPKNRKIPSRMRAYVMERDGFRCRRCGCCSDDRALNVDHVIPFSRGGLTEEKNLQTLCSLCNNGKSDAHPHAHDLRP